MGNCFRFGSDGDFSNHSLIQQQSLLAGDYADGFWVSLSGRSLKDGQPAFEFIVKPPLPRSSDVDAAATSSSNSFGEVLSVLPDQIIRRTYQEFVELATVVSLCYRTSGPPLPAATLFTYDDAAFLDHRAADLEVYLQKVLLLDPWPKNRVLRRFLNIHLPPRLQRNVSCGDIGETALVVHMKRFPVGLVSAILSFMEPLWVLRSAGSVCQAMRDASRNPRCWPTLRFVTSKAERWLDHFFCLLLPTCGPLQSLSMDIGFLNPKLAVVTPQGLSFQNLIRLVLRPRDAEAAMLAAELLEAMESPFLREVTLDGEIGVEVLSALTIALFLGGGALEALRIIWAAPPVRSALILNRDIALCLRRLLEVTPGLKRLRLEAAGEACGCVAVKREILPLSPPEVAIPGVLPLLADLAVLPHLQEFVFDFLSDDALVGLQQTQFPGFENEEVPEVSSEEPPSARRSQIILPVRRVAMSGVKGVVEDPEQALATLMASLSDRLEEFTLLIDFEAEAWSVMSVFFGIRIGALPSMWQNHGSLRALCLNWTAFDDDGVRSIAEHCPRLQSLMLDHSEYWTDVVADIVVDLLPELRFFRLRRSDFLSDRALFKLLEVAHRFSVLEVELSPMMSHFVLDQLRERMSPQGPGLNLSASDAAILGLTRFGADLATRIGGAFLDDFELELPPEGDARNFGPLCHGELVVLDSTATAALNVSRWFKAANRRLEIGR